MLYSLAIKPLLQRIRRTLANRGKFPRVSCSSEIKGLGFLGGLQWTAGGVEIHWWVFRELIVLQKLGRGPVDGRLRGWSWLLPCVSYRGGTLADLQEVAETGAHLDWRSRRNMEREAAAKRTRPGAFPCSMHIHKHTRTHARTTWSEEMNQGKFFLFPAGQHYSFITPSHTRGQINIFSSHSLKCQC